MFSGKFLYKSSVSFTLSGLGLSRNLVFFGLQQLRAPLCVCVCLSERYRQNFSLNTCKPALVLFHSRNFSTALIQ